MPWNFRRVCVDAREILVIIIHIEPAILRNDGTAYEKIGPKPRRLPAQLCGVEHTPDVVPTKSANEPFFAINQLLTSDLERDRKFFEISQRDERLVQINHIRFRPVAFA